mgnify:CR=1 FL=1
MGRMSHSYQSKTETIWIARHGNRIDFVRPEWFDTAERRYDPHLSDDGIVQAQQLGCRLRDQGIAHIFASPFLRTVQTAHYVAELLDLPIKLEWGLCEWLNPEWMSEMPATLSPEVLAKQFPEIDLSYQSRFHPQYPETETECFQRAGETAQYLSAAFSGDLLLVGHGASVLGATLGLVPGTPTAKIHGGLCCLVKVVWGATGWSLELKGDTSHLTQRETAIRFH